MTEQDIREEFFLTRDAALVLARRTALVDQVVRERWAWMPQGVALAAVGGYGRAELFPCSDIDLLILVPLSEFDASLDRFLPAKCKFI